jgi:hypothetical protein
LHLQAAAEINWNSNNSKSLTKLRSELNLDEFKDIFFMISVKTFEAGQTWMDMVGYSQKISYCFSSLLNGSLMILYCSVVQKF